MCISDLKGERLTKKVKKYDRFIIPKDTLILLNFNLHLRLDNLERENDTLREEIDRLRAKLCK